MDNPEKPLKFEGNVEDTYEGIFKSVKKEIVAINNKGVVFDNYSTVLLLNKLLGEVSHTLLESADINLELNHEYIEKLVQIIAISSKSLREYLDSFEADFE